jgi:hypothetical protein
MQIHDSADTTRRNLLFGGSAALLATAAAPAGAAAMLGAGDRPALADLAHGDIADWAPLVGQRFGLAAASGASLRLVAVNAAPTDAASDSKRGAGFTALFEAVGPAPEGNATYWLSSSGAKPFPIFLGPRSGDASAKLVAVFG